MSEKMRSEKDVYQGGASGVLPEKICARSYISNGQKWLLRCYNYFYLLINYFAPDENGITPWYREEY